MSALTSDSYLTGDINSLFYGVPGLQNDSKNNKSDKGKKNTNQPPSKSKPKPKQSAKSKTHKHK